MQVNTIGPTAAIRAQPDGDETMEHGAAHAGATVALVPARVTRHVVVVQAMALLPVFLMVMARDTGLAVADAPPVSDTDTTWMLELVDAEPARLKTAAVTTPPTARTAAMMMNRSMLCEIALR